MKKLTLFSALVIFCAACVLFLTSQTKSFEDDLASRLAKSTNYIAIHDIENKMMSEVKTENDKHRSIRNQFSQHDRDLVWRDNKLNKNQREDALVKMGVIRSDEYKRLNSEWYSYKLKLSNEFPELHKLSPQLNQSVYKKARIMVDKAEESTVVDYMEHKN